MKISGLSDLFVFKCYINIWKQNGNNIEEIDFNNLKFYVRDNSCFDLGNMKYRDAISMHKITIHNIYRDLLTYKFIKGICKLEKLTNKKE